MTTRLLDLLCRALHRRTMWPIKGRYICATCHREFPVRWEVRP